MVGVFLFDSASGSAGEYCLAKQRMTFAKQYCTGDPDPPVVLQLNKVLTK